MAYGYESLGNFAWVEQQKGGHFQFLTVQSLALAWIAMICSLVVDFFPSSTSLQTIKRTLYMAAIPVAVLVSSVYWTLLVLFPELILQVDPTSPPSAPVLIRLAPQVDLALHATPVVTLIIDFIFLQSRYTRKESLYAAPVVVLLAGAWYGWWVEYCASYNGVFPYPFLTENPLEIRVSIYAAATTLSLVSFWTINNSHP